MQHRHIFIFNLKTIIRVFRLLSLQVLQIRSLNSYQICIILQSKS